MVSPCLPPELEYIIFVLAFEVDRRKTTNLLLVAKRIFDWLIPHIFNVVEFSRDKSLPIAFNEVVYNQYGHHVHDLRIETPEIAHHLHLFPNVTSLTMWIRIGITPYLPILLDLPLKHLSVFGMTPSTELFQIMSRLTHLDLMTHPKLWSMTLTTVKELLYLPKLTHLAFPYSFLRPGLELFLDRRRCPELRVVMVWGGLVPEVDDQRVLIVDVYPMKNRNWEEGGRWVDMWKPAEEVIASRRCVRKMNSTGSEYLT
ncbi:hypothetical protein BDN72DRAFT_845825 [Pluteus cervinus]|uniref:Uncharacterized protein n=1 Tax=Pluteus cervinus TaxID=181527 RepID=A0ACD3AI94_9AGAR|nr:hypothetical protein BDN72DRAFT_845825 [Pluteus cervinus]